MPNIEMKALLVGIPEGTTHYQDIEISNDAAVRFFKVEGKERLVWGVDQNTHRPGWIPTRPDHHSNYRGPLLPISYGLGTTDQLGGQA